MLKSNEVKETLQNADLHEEWISAYRTPENERFFEAAFDYIVKELDAPKDAAFLDAGCGSCAHSMRLARRGFAVQAVDFSSHILTAARERLEHSGLSDRVALRQEDILAMSFPEKTFDYVLCWGVLMHIPDVDTAMSELARVLKPGGFLIISESNVHSLQAVAFRSLKRLVRREKATVVKTVAGLEYWHTRSSGRLVTRQTDFRWMKHSFANLGLRATHHVSGQFTELYTILSSSLARRLIHGVNHLWFKYIRLPYFAFGNILILRRDA